MNSNREPRGLTGTDRSIALLEFALMQQRGRLARMERAGQSTVMATTVLQAGESVLKSLRSYRKLLSVMVMR